MTSLLHIKYLGVFYHVMNRGKTGDSIFISDRDKEKFAEYLTVAVSVSQLSFIHIV